MAKLIIDLAVEIADCRDTELPYKLLKLKDILKSNEDLVKIKHEIYKYDILEALSVSFKNEYGYIKDGWNLAIDLVKIFGECTKDFGTIDKVYQDVFLPNAVENILTLAKKIQEKYIKSKAYSEEFLKNFKTLMQEYNKINSNNSNIALKSLKSPRLFQLLLVDEQNTSAIMMNTIRNLFMIKRSLITQLDEKTVFLILDEVIYKMATSDLKEAGLSIFQLLTQMCQMDPNLIRLIVRRYKGIKMLANKWNGRSIDKELNEFLNAWDGASRERISNLDLDHKATIIQKTWRGYMTRVRMRKVNQAFTKFQQKFRAKRQRDNDKKQRENARNELRFQLVLEHRRKQRQRKMELLELLEVLPSSEIESYFEKQREYSAKLIQANFRGYLSRKKFQNERIQLMRTKAAVQIQRTVRRWLEKLRKKRQTPAFYSRPLGLDSTKREIFFDRIRKHLESLPPHPRSEKELSDLHDKGQRMFHNYVLNQRLIRQQQQKMQMLMAISKNDADLILNCPKLSQVTEEDVNNYYTHKSTPVMLAAKEAHKRMLRNQRANWYEKLMDDSESEPDESCDKKFDELNSNIMSLNFDAVTENYYIDKQSKKHAAFNNNFTHMHESFQKHQSLSKRQRNQLKTNVLKKSVAHMMNATPNKSRIWNLELN